VYRQEDRTGEETSLNFTLLKRIVRKHSKGWVSWLMSVIPATWEGGDKGSQFKADAGKYLKKIMKAKKDWVCGSTSRALP
jgi:hypothetical protein